MIERKPTPSVKRKKGRRGAGVGVGITGKRASLSPVSHRGGNERETKARKELRFGVSEGGGKKAETIGWKSMCVSYVVFCSRLAGDCGGRR